MDKEPSAMNITLRVPPEEHRGFTLREFIRILVANRRVILIMTAVFLLLGCVLGYLARPKPQPAPEAPVGGLYSVTLSFTHDGIEEGLAPDGKRLNIQEILDPALVASAQNQALIAPEIDLYSHLSVEGVVPPDAARLIAAYEELGNVEKKAQVTYISTAYTVTLRVDEEILAQESKIPSFLTALSESYLQRVDPSQSLVDTTLDYPLLVHDADWNIRELLLDSAGQENAAEWQSLQKELVEIAMQIESQKLSRDRDALLAYLEYELPVLRRLHATYTERVLLLTGRLGISATPQDSEGIPGLFMQEPRQIIADIAGISNRISYYEYLQTTYAEPGVGASATAVDQAIQDWTQKAESLLEEYDGGIAVSSPVMMPFPAPEVSTASASSTKTIMIVAGMAFLGLFLSLLYVFGKRALLEE